jgi:ArsR family transcriptional regulator
VVDYLATMGYHLEISRYDAMKEIVALGKSLADPIRVRILNALAQGELCVCELVDALEVNQSTVSTHLQTLRNAGVVTTEKRQKWTIYSLDPNAEEAVVAALAHFPPTGDRIDRDNERLCQRIRLRVDGCCVLGAGQLSQELILA